MQTQAEETASTQRPERAGDRRHVDRLLDQGARHRVGHPVEGSFRKFREANPWVGGLDVRPKSIGREMFEGYYGFADYVRRYGLQRSEGVLLRYLSQLYKTLDQTVPDHAKAEPVWDALGFSAPSSNAPTRP